MATSNPTGLTEEELDDWRYVHYGTGLSRTIVVTCQGWSSHCYCTWNSEGRRVCCHCGERMKP